MENVVAGQTGTAALFNTWTPVVLSGTVTPASGWSVSQFNAVWCAGITFIQVEMLRTGSGITANSAGTISSSLCTLPYLPPFQMWSAFQAGNVSAGTALIDVTGAVGLQTFYPSQTIANGAVVYFSAAIPTG